MLTRNTVVMVCVIMLILVPLYPTVSGSHQNFDEVEEDISALLSALRIVHLYMEEGLNNTLTVEHNLSSEGSEFTYTEGPLYEAQDNFLDAYESTAPAKRIINEIKDDVPSYIYLDELYMPYHETSGTLFEFSKEHVGINHNISDAVHFYIESDGDDHAVLSQGMSSLENAMVNLRRMEKHYDDAVDNIDVLNQTVKDPGSIGVLLDGLPSLIEDYGETLDQLEELYGHVPAYMSINVPETTHPGETFLCEGFVWDEGFAHDREVTVEVEGIGYRTAVTEEDGYYSLSIDVPWDKLGEIRLNATSGALYAEATVDVIQYDTEVILSTDRPAYYQEMILFEGYFRTSAEVNLSEITLNVSTGETFNPNPDGNISLEYHTSDFHWGTNSVTVSFHGDRILKPSSTTVSFEISIPTHITLEGSVFDDNISFYGTLFNSSSDLGLQNETVLLQFDGDMFGNTTTHANGSYTFDLTLDDLPMGHHAVNTRFPGGQRYRACTSPILYLLVTEEGAYVGTDPIDDIPDDDENGVDDGNGDDDGLLTTTIDDDRILLFFVLVVMSIAVLTYVLKKKQDEDIDTVSESERRVELTKKSKPVHVDRKDDVLRSYGALMREIDSRNVINVVPGKTHREVKEDMVKLYGLAKHFDTVTQVFEKASFTNIDLDAQEFDRYNRSMSRIWGVCFS